MRNPLDTHFKRNPVITVLVMGFCPCWFFSEVATFPKVMMNNYSGCDTEEAERCKFVNNF